jgi:hypothetical protein
MLGCAFYNYSFLQRKTEITIAPMYAFGSKTPVGYADITKYITQNNNVFQQITLNAKAKSFAYNYINTSAFNEANSTTINSFNLITIKYQLL